jgi:hypothetical protein
MARRLLPSRMAYVSSRAMQVRFWSNGVKQRGAGDGS